MPSRRRTSARLRRVPPLAWVLAVAVVAAGLVASLGGFAPALDRGRPVAPGEQVLTARWRVQVDRAALVDDSVTGSDPDPRIRLWLRLEFTGEETTCCLPERMIEVRYGDQRLTEVWRSTLDPRSVVGYDPGVAVDRVLELPLADGRLPDPVPSALEVVVRDERPSRNVVLRGDWAVASAVAGVGLPVPDERERR